MMSFETWFEKFAGGRTCYQSMVEAYDGGHAEAEAQIAALQSEREELRKALREGLRCVHGLLEEKSNDDLTTRPFLIGCQLWFREKSFLVSTPASGEPARKP